MKFLYRPSSDVSRFLLLEAEPDFVPVVEGEKPAPDIVNDAEQAERDYLRAIGLENVPPNVVPAVLSTRNELAGLEEETETHLDADLAQRVADIEDRRAADLARVSDGLAKVIAELETESAA